MSLGRAKLSWNYALSKKLASDDVRVIIRETQNYPWDVGQSPLRLEVETARIVSNWKLMNDILVTDIPDHLQLVGPERTLQLDPLGSTLLRLTVFAKGDY